MDRKKIIEEISFKHPKKVIRNAAKLALEMNGSNLVERAKHPLSIIGYINLYIDLLHEKPSRRVVFEVNKIIIEKYGNHGLINIKELAWIKIDSVY